MNTLDRQNVKIAEQSDFSDKVFAFPFCVFFFILLPFLSLDLDQIIPQCIALRQ
jgi:hypothetical protein